VIAWPQCFITYSNSWYGDDEIDYFSIVIVGICDDEVRNGIEIFFYTSIVY